MQVEERIRRSEEQLHVDREQQAEIIEEACRPKDKRGGHVKTDLRGGRYAGSSSEVVQGRAGGVGGREDKNNQGQQTSGELRSDRDPG